MSLIDRIPKDVRERLAKAGVSDVDWYSGRMDEGTTFFSVGKQRRKELRRRIRRLRRGCRDV